MGTFFIVCFICFVVYQIFKTDSNTALGNQNSKSIRGGHPNSSTTQQGYRDLEFTIRTGAYGESRRNRVEQLSTDGNEFWLSEEKAVEIKGYNINKGLLYVGKNLSTAESRSYWREIEPALINPTLAVNSVDPDYEGRSLSYWSSYKGISAEARAAYLEWLETGRNNPETPIGYVFLYYYGLERRLLYDLKELPNDAPEKEVIINEIKRLRSIYSNNGSFDHYSQSLLDYLAFKDSAKEKLEEAFENEERDYTKYERSYNGRINFKLALAYCALNSIPLPAGLALKWAIHDKYLRTPGTRCKEELQALFKIKYKRKYGDGDILKPNKTTISFSYRPASNTYGYSNGFYFTTDIPDLLRLEAQPKKYYAIVEECIDELDAYSRQIGRGNDPENIKALSKLPKELLTQKIDGRFGELFRQINSELTNEEFVFKKTLAVTSLWNPDSNTKLSKKDSIEIAQFFSKYEIGFEPDARFDNNKIDSDEKMVFFRIDSKKSPRKPSKEYQTALTILHLSVVIGLADGVFKVEEKTYLESYIEDIFNLSDEEKKRIHGYLLWLEHNKPSTRGVKSKIDGLTIKEREQLLLYLVKLSDADGYIHPKEVEMLQKIAGILDIDSQQVFSLIHSVQAKDDEPILVKNKDESIGYRLPTESNGNELNRDAITKTLKETEEIQSILSDIFNDEDDEIQTPEPKTQQADIVGKPLLAIDEYHSNLLSKLLEKDEWDRDEYEELCSELNLFPEGALEIINESSFNAYDDELLIDNGVIIINRELLQINNG